MKNSSVYIAGLTYDTTEEQLKELFSDCGTIQYVEIVRNDDGLSKGYGYVTFSTLEAAEKAVQIKNEASLNGKFIKVQYPQKFDTPQPKKSKKSTSKPEKSKRKPKHKHHHHRRHKYSSSSSSDSASSGEKEENPTQEDKNSKKLNYSSDSSDQ